MLRRIGEMELSELLTNLKEINEFKIDIEDYLDLMLVWFRDVLLFKVTSFVLFLYLIIFWCRDSCDWLQRLNHSFFWENRF